MEEGTKTKIEKLIEDYKKSKEKYSRFAKSISQLFNQLLNSSNIKFQQVTFREKEIEKLKEKYGRKPALVDMPLENVHDLAGCRVIFYLEEDIHNFAKILQREFEIIDLEKKEDPTGYNSLHVIIKLDERRNKLAEYSEFSNLICEIQLTTVLFHVWSEVNHDIIYKKEDGTAEFSKKDMEFIEEKLKEIMRNYIWKANYSFSFVVGQHERLKKGMQILNIDTLKEFTKCDSNEDILSYVLKLNNFSGLYRLPKEFDFLDTLDKLLQKAKQNDKTDSTIYSKIIGASFDFLKNIVYWDCQNIINFCIVRISKEEYTEDCIKVLLELSKYNLNVVRIIGYKPQEALLDKIKGVDTSKELNEFLIKIYRNLLNTTLEGTSQNEFDTFTFSYGPIYINEQLKKVRSNTIELLFSLIDEKNSSKYNESIIEALFSSIKTHHQAIRKEDLEVLRDNAKVILSKIIGNYSSIKDCMKRKIERELKYPSKPVFEEIDEVVQLIELINKDQEYQKYRAFIGYETDYGPEWRSVETERKELLDKFIEDLSEDDVDEWINYLKNILKDYEKRDYGLFQNLHYFLNELGKKKPKLGEKFKSVSELKDFQVALICGLLESENKEKYYDEIEDWISKSERLLDIATTFRFILGYGEETFSNLVVSSLKEEDINQLLELLLTICKNYKIGKSTKDQFIQIIKKLTEKNFYDWPHRISFISDDITKDLSGEEYDIILASLINKDHIGYDTEKILVPLTEKEPKKIVDFFYKRVESSEGGRNLIDSIPHNFQLLKEPLSKKADIVVPKTLDWLNKKEWKYKWESGHLLNIIFPKINEKLKDILIAIIKEKDTRKLDQIFWVLDKYTGTIDILNIVYEIVKNHKITNKIRNRLFAILSHTGIVTGKYGIAEAYKTKIENMKSWLNDSSDEIVEFAKGYITYLENAIKYEKARVDKEFDLMKSEFDRSKM